MDKIIIASAEDRLTVAAILVKNDYTVRQGKQHDGILIVLAHKLPADLAAAIELLRPGKKSYEYYLEYAPNDKPKQAAGE